MSGAVSMICALFGNSKLFEDVEQILQQALCALIQEHSTVNFYVGTHGDFDSAALRVLKKLKGQYPFMDYTIILAYLPTKKDALSDSDASHSVFPQILDSVPLRFAIDKRNRFMLEQADIILTYTRYSTGNTAKYKQLAVKKGKTVIELFCK